METHKLVFLVGDLPAQRLVSAWPDVIVADDEAETYERWSEISGVDIDDVLKLAPVLFRNGLVGPDGYVEPLAVQYIANTIGRSMPKVPR